MTDTPYLDTSATAMTAPADQPSDTTSPAPAPETSSSSTSDTTSTSTSTSDVPERDDKAARADEEAPTATSPLGAGDFVVQRYDDPYDEAEVIRVGFVAGVDEKTGAALVAFLPTPSLVAVDTLERA